MKPNSCNLCCLPGLPANKSRAVALGWIETGSVDRGSSCERPKIFPEAVLSEGECKLLREKLDDEFKRLKVTEDGDLKRLDVEDLRMTLSTEELESCLGKGAVDRLSVFFNDSYDTIRLRRVCVEGKVRHLNSHS